MIILINHGWMMVCLVPPPFALKSLSNFFCSKYLAQLAELLRRARARVLSREKFKASPPHSQLLCKNVSHAHDPAGYVGQQWVEHATECKTIFQLSNNFLTISMLKLNMLMQKTTTTARNGGKECHNLKAYESRKICRQMTQLCQ